MVVDAVGPCDDTAQDLAVGNAAFGLFHLGGSGIAFATMGLIDDTQGSQADDGNDDGNDDGPPKVATIDTS